MLLGAVNDAAYGDSRVSGAYAVRDTVVGEAYTLTFAATCVSRNMRRTNRFVFGKPFAIYRCAARRELP